MINIFDKSKNKVFMTDRIIEPFLTCDINKLDILTFEIDKENLKYFELEGYVETKEQIYVIKDIEELQYTFKIVALQEIEEFDEYLNNKTYPTKTLDFMIKDLLPSGWSLVFKGDTKKRTVTGNNINKFSLINEIIKKFEAEIRFDNKKKTVTVGYDLGEDNGSYFTDELNIKDIHFTGDSYDLVTRIIPIGRDNLGIEKVNDGKPYIDNFEYSKKIKTMYWEDNRYLNVHSLFDDANKKLKKLSTPNITYEIDVIDLSENLKYEFLKMNLGDKVTLINKNSQKKEQFRIIKLVKYFKDSFRNEITLGTKVPDLTTDEYKLREVFNENWEKTKTYFEVVDGKITGIIDTVKSSETNIEKMKSEVIQTADEIKLKISKYDGLLGEISKKQSEISQKTDSLESSIYESTQLGKDNFLKNISLNLSDTKEFKEYLNLENGSYSLKFLSKGDVEVYFVVRYKDENRKYQYKYPKKFLSLKKVGRSFNDLSFKEHLISFKVPKLYKDMYISYKSKNGAELKEIQLGKLLSKENADRITRLKQDLDGFKLTAENNINKVKSEFNVKADEISSKVKNVENKISTEIAQSTNEIKSTVKEMKEDLKQFKNLCKESTKEINGNDIYFDCEKLLKGQKYKVTFKAKDIQNNAEYKVYNSDMNYRKISENNAWVFTPSQDITQLNLYNGGGSNPKANIYDVQIFKLNDDPRLEELKSEIKQTSTEISLKVSKKDIVSEINQSAESVKIRANKIELDGDVIANKLTSKRLYGNYIDGAVINGGTIKIGNYGFLQPAQNCLQIKVPQTQYATYGIGVQIHGRKATKNIPAGMFIYRDDDFERGNDIGDNVEEILLTVAGRMQACFKFNGQEISGTPVMTNFYKNNPVGGDMYAIRFIGYDPHTRCIYFDDGTGSSGAWRLSTDSSSSDIRLKFNIKESNQDCLDLISKINFKSFDWKKDKFGYAKEHTKTGIIADELQELDDSLVYTHTNDDKKTKYIDDFRLLAVTTKAVQELNKKVEELQLKIKQLEER
jgi:phage minor structural protein